MRNPIVVGIDPGINGGVCIMRADSPAVFPMPTYTLPNGKKEVDAGALGELLPLDDSIDLYVIEEVNGDPKFGGGRAFNFGKSFGKVLGFLEYASSLSKIIRVRPQKWKPAILGDNRTKDDAVKYVQSLYPDLNLTLPRKRKPSHDLAESVCLALYGLRQLESSGAT